MQPLDLTAFKQSLQNKILRGGVGSLSIRFFSTLLSLLLGIVLARTLGPQQYGIYSFVMAVLYILAVPALMGLPQLVIRETARTEANGAWGVMCGLWRWSVFSVLTISLVIAISSSVILTLLSSFLSESRYTTLVVGIWLIPLLAFGNLCGAALRGLRRIVIGQIPESILRPAILALLVISGITVGPMQATAVNAMSLQICSAILVLMIAASLLTYLRPTTLREHLDPIYHSSAWFAAAVPLAITAGLHLINQHLDILMLGFLRNDAEVGIYKVVVTGAALVAFGLHAITTILAPYFARLYSQGDLLHLQYLVTISARAIFALAMPVTLILVIFGKDLLYLAFGQEYVTGYLALIILACGQLVNSTMGSSGALLNMTGHEREAMRAVGFSALLNIFLNALLIPPFGIEGAAIATAFTFTFLRIKMCHAVHAKLGINSLALWRVQTLAER